MDEQYIDSTGTDAVTTLPAVQTARGLELVGNTDSMKAALEVRKERTKIIHEYIDSIFVEGVDYGPADERNPKKTLLKPGATKICNAFNTTPRWRRDSDTWEMLGSVPGMACYVCEIIDNKTGGIVGEGRGSSVISEKKGWDSNKTIKAAEKRAIVDAAIYTFDLASFFTQEDTGRGTRSHPAQDLNLAKRKLLGDISEARRGIESDMTDAQFIVAVCKAELHKASASTVGEVDHLREAILADHRYMLATAERQPGNSEV